jgi:hypothetical protein
VKQIVRYGFRNYKQPRRLYCIKEPSNHYQFSVPYLHNGRIYREKAWVIAYGMTPAIMPLQKWFKILKIGQQNTFLNIESADFEVYYPDIFKEDISLALTERK